MTIDFGPYKKVQSHSAKDHVVPLNLGIVSKELKEEMTISAGDEGVTDNNSTRRESDVAIEQVGPVEYLLLGFISKCII